LFLLDRNYLVLRLRVEGERWLIRGLIACMVMAATISPWIIRNAIVFHRFISMRDNMGLDLWLGNNGHSLHWTDNDLNPEHDPRELADYNTMGELSYMDYKMRQPEAYIGDYPGWYAWMCVRRAVYLWTGFWSFDRDYLAQEPMDLADIPFATSLTLLALLGLVTTWRKKPLGVRLLRRGAFSLPVHVLLRSSRCVPDAATRSADCHARLPVISTKHLPDSERERVTEKDVRD
jgi:hypothetical protein